jgi:preprotein translocase subunit SecE
MRDKVLNFFREIRGEFNRISWPGRVEMIGLTTLVIIIVVLLSLYLFLLDSALRMIIEWLL